MKTVIYGKKKTGKTLLLPSGKKNTRERSLNTRERALRQAMERYRNQVIAGEQREQVLERTIEALKGRLNRIGMRPSVFADREAEIRKMHMARLTGDLAAAIIAARGCDMTTQELNEAVRSGHQAALWIHQTV